LKWPAECEVGAAKGEDLVTASQGSGGTAMNCSVFWRAWECEAAIIRVSSLEDALSVSGCKSKEGYGKEAEVGHCGELEVLLDVFDSLAREKT
jgi:hypothetical protein